MLDSPRPKARPGAAAEPHRGDPGGGPLAVGLGDELAAVVLQRVLGVVENMSAMVMPDGSTMDLFGSGGGAEVARALGEGAELLGSVPLSPTLRSDGDAGTPSVIAHPEDPSSQAIAAVAERIAASGRGLAGRKLPVRTR